LSKTLNVILQLDNLSTTLINQLNESLRPEFVALILKESEEFHIQSCVGNEEKLNNFLKEVNLESIKDEPEIIKSQQMVIPLSRKSKIIGYIVLGEKLSGKTYNSEDISLMKMLSYQAAISIENATIYERLRKRVKYMEDANNRLIEAFKKSHPDLPAPEKILFENGDIITELDLIAESLIKSSEKLRELDELKTSFLSNVSHELRTPLASIKGYADNLLDCVAGELDEKQRKYIERISQNCDRLGRMINDLLNLSRIESGRIKFEPTNLLLFPLISEVVFSFSSIAEKRDIYLDFHCLSDVKVFADGDKLREILINLIDNAIKFTPSKGSVFVQVNAADDEYIIISVEDTGIGIPPENLDKIFDRFYQIKQGVHKESNGLGIGLAIVKNLVELHKGNVSVQSEIEKGSRFIIKLPKI
ncbi:hypothetical protein FJZ33_09740, partial [Candidatus Poribacteria bacterium]|nr:hypothetical protein [Candidatus Poribacteria bacterium]